MATPPFLHQPPPPHPTPSISGSAPLSSKKCRIPLSDSIFGRSYPPLTIAVYYKILGCQTLWYSNGGSLNIRQNLSPKLVFLTYFSKDSTKTVMKIYKSIVIESLKLVPLSPIKWWVIKVFAKPHKSYFNS